MIDKNVSLKHTREKVPSSTPNEEKRSYSTLCQGLKKITTSMEIETEASKGKRINNRTK